jgi:hypothetical protein
MSEDLQIIPFDIGRPVISRAAGGDQIKLGWIFGLPPSGAFVTYPPNHQPVLTERRDLAFVDRGIGGTGTKEERARAYCAEVLAGTTLSRERHAEVIEQMWHRFQPLVALEGEAPAAWPAAIRALSPRVLTSPAVPIE